MQASQSSGTHYCSACLCNSADGYKLHDFEIKHTQFWQIFEVASIKLCYICRRLAQQAVLFIQNVQSNQILLQNCMEDISTLKEALNQLKNPLNLGYFPLDSINIIGNTHVAPKLVRTLPKIKQEKNGVVMLINKFKIEIDDESYEMSDGNTMGEFEEHAYKTDTLLKQHLKTTQIHVNVAEFPLGCEQCEKRFMKPRELERHVNAVHLDIKPYKCDVCDKSFTCPSTLRDHRRVVHEGYKKPLKYCCEYCDKRFSNSSVLKAHIRTHTGERPYQCDDCPARFSQSGVLATHKKLIHQRLTRYGNPK